MSEANTSESNAAAVTVTAALSPHGTVHLVAAPGDTGSLDAQTAVRLSESFARGSAHGLLHLGAVETGADLPPAFEYWREFVRLFMARLCALPDIESQRESFEVPAPQDELVTLANAAPPMVGGEYLSRAVLAGLWSDLQTLVREELAAWKGTVADWLQSKNPMWSNVGRVCFHLAENKNHPTAPFAFLATYTTRVSAGGRVQHRPLGKALEEYAGARNRSALLSLLTPVQRAATQSALVKELVDSGEIYHPLAWSPREAHALLREIPTLEASGVMVRVPDWWNARRPVRPSVQVTVGKRVPSDLGLDAMLDFSVGVTLDGDVIEPAEWKALLDANAGLALLKGRWVEVDGERLRAVLDHWKIAQDAARDGVSFAEAMRLIAGAPLGSETADAKAADAVAEWSHVVPGDWFRKTLDGLRDPQVLGSADPGTALHAQLRPYQQVGVRWLWWLYNLGLGGCLADDMGLGKTIQVLALLLLIKQRGASRPNLLVVPASLIGNWKSEIERFAPSLTTRVVHPSAMRDTDIAAMGAGDLAGIDLVITTYGGVARFPVVAGGQWNLVVLDEAQAIKNPGAKQTRATKALASRVRLVLTGTPVENRAGDLWSLFDFAAPGLLGSAKAFTRFTKQAADRNVKAFAPLRNLVKPYILRRLKTDKRIIDDLPEKTELLAYCALTRRQAALYQQSVSALAKQLEEVEGINRRGAVLAFLMRFKQICNHPSQWLGDGAYAADDSGKFARLRELCEEIASRQEKVLVFTQFREMTGPLASYLATVFGRPGLVLHGETAVKNRKKLVDEFQGEDGPPFFVLSLKAGGVGLNLTAASHVIHFDRWWNPAVENQATDRAFRIGQKKNVLVHKFVCRGTIEERIATLIDTKQGLSTEILEGSGEIVLTELSNDELMKLVTMDMSQALAES